MTGSGRLLRWGVAPLSAIVALLSMTIATAQTPSSSDPVVVVAAGVANPRGLELHDGTLLVASAGTGGETARILQIAASGCPEPLGESLPTSRVVFGAPVGFADVAVLDDVVYGLMAGGDSDNNLAHNGLYRLEPDGTLALVADVSDFIRANPVATKPGDFDNDGQPVRLLPLPDGSGFLATEGNSGQLLRLGLDGTVSRVADLSADHPVPTGLVAAPDGAVFVAYFDHAPYPEGAGKVVRIEPDGTVSDAWTGLTMAIDLAVGPDGSLYAAEMATGYGGDPTAIQPGTGKIVRQTGPASSEEVVTGLDFPAAIAFGDFPDGVALYVAGPVIGAEGERGTVVRLDPAAFPITLSSQDLTAGTDCGTPDDAG